MVSSKMENSHSTFSDSALSLAVYEETVEGRNNKTIQVSNY